MRLRAFTVVGIDDDTPFVQWFQAEDTDHAVEQAINAAPALNIMAVFRGALTVEPFTAPSCATR
ncbi:MAG: hypothetical protein ACYDAG_02470 [Chloroflexota bacterium]